MISIGKLKIAIEAKTVTKIAFKIKTFLLINTESFSLNLKKWFQKSCRETLVGDATSEFWGRPRNDIWKYGWQLICSGQILKCHKRVLKR